MMLLLVGSTFAVTVDDIMKNFVKVEKGKFTMGSKELSNEQPVHVVFLDTYFITKYEITVEEYVYFLNQTGKKYNYCSKNISHINGSRGNYLIRKNEEKFPVIYISWDDANSFCIWLSGKTGKNIQLPTEAQWEKAARGGNRSKGYKYSGANVPFLFAWYERNADDMTHPVGLKRPNELGLHDMSGNVWEWCSDRYGKDYYSISPEKNPKGPINGAYRVHRGGSWVFNAGPLRSAFRNYYKPTYRFNNLGFRIVSTD